MASRYDSRTTTFSPQGRLYQVEYAMEAISQAGSAMGILATDGVVLACEKRITSKLLDVRSSTEKLYKIDDHVAVAVAGITADANILINEARLAAQRHTFTYGQPMPLEQLLHQVCDIKQSYTQYGGLRPFGVSFLFAGWDEHHGFQLFQSDPSGNFGGWKATAIGSNAGQAQSLLKTDYDHATTTVEKALELAVRLLAKTMDATAPEPEKVEFATVTRDDRGRVVYRVLSKSEVATLVAKVAKEEAAKKPAAEGGDK